MSGQWETAEMPSRADLLRQALRNPDTGDWFEAFVAEIDHHIKRYSWADGDPIEWSRSPGASALDGLLKLIKDTEARLPPVTRRLLPPELAREIKEAKVASKMSWRELAEATGLSHSFLIQLSNGQRAPSLQTVETLVSVLPLEDWVVDELRAWAE